MVMQYRKGGKKGGREGAREGRGRGKKSGGDEQEIPELHEPFELEYVLTPQSVHIEAPAAKNKHKRWNQSLYTRTRMPA
jgi:hypothetical protein